MPNFDNSGPQGQGPQTGRGMGRCQTGTEQLTNNQQGGAGLGLRRGGRCRPNGGNGRGQGRGNRGGGRGMGGGNR